MQTFLLVKVILGLLIQRSAARLLDEACGKAVTTPNAAAAWMAAVRNETQFLCGGTLIHKRFVLTSARCIEDRGRLFVTLGAYKLSDYAADYRVTHAVVHSEYSRETLQNDISLLRLPLDVVYTEHIHPICIDLQPTTKQRTATTFDAFGWGIITQAAANMSKILQRVTLNRYHSSRCNNTIEKQICAGSSSNSSDTVDTFLGGPLIGELNYEGIRRLTQLGILSQGLGNGNVAISTNLTSYAEWIEEKIKAPYTEDSWKNATSAAAAQANPVPIIPPIETENLGQAELLVEPCGIAVSPRISGGNNAEPEAGAWMAAVFNGTGLLCGSTVIHRRFVLTTAGCARQENIFVRLGAYDRRYATKEFNVTKRIMHGEYDDTRHINDIGLLQLSGDIVFSRNVYPICIIVNAEVKSKVDNAYTFDAYGWGGTNDHLLQKITLDLHDRSECNDYHRVKLSSRHICAGSSVGAACNGDLGGPLIKTFIANGYQRQTQIGVISQASINCKDVGVYTNITSYVDWIVRHVKGPNLTKDIAAL